MPFSTSGQITLGDISFSETNNTGKSCIYANRNREIGEPQQLVISHQQVTKKDAQDRIRSMVKLSDTVRDPDTSVPETLNVHIVVDRPTQGIVTKATIQAALDSLQLMVSGPDFVDKLVNCEV